MIPPQGSASRHAGPRVGLLGGSFNPAHEGHLHISRLALDRLGLDELWWLVSPQNPLKQARGMASFGERLAGARAMAGDGAGAGDPRIVVSDLERELATRYTADTLAALVARFPGTAFVWVMGADNLAQVSRWKDWTAIFEAVPIAVFDRPSYSEGALVSDAARRFARFRIDPSEAHSLAGSEPPAWVFVEGELNDASASRIREGGAGDDQ